MKLQSKFLIVFFYWMLSDISSASDSRASDGINVDGCGVSKNIYNGAKIVGGRTALEGEYPWQLSLEMQLVPVFTEFRHICGASVVNNNWAITAAHCIAGGYFTRYRVIAGTKNISTRAKPAKSNAIPIVHEGYNPVASLKNDIAMLRLTTPLDMASSDGIINAACFPPASYADQATGMSTVSGWGTTSQGGSLSSDLLSVDVPVMTDEKCREAYEDNIENTMLCAGYDEGGRDSCQGDSGGPLIQRADNGIASLIGIVSWGRGCAQAGNPGVYTETAHYIDWISRTMQRTGTPSPDTSTISSTGIYFRIQDNFTDEGESSIRR